MERNLQFVVTEEDGAFVASCQEIEITSEGDTAEEALANLKEAVELYYEDDDPIVLTRRESLRLLALIENQPPRTEKFLQAMADYEKGKLDDGDSSIDWSPR
ncbi:MAG: hypothetical protein KJ899_08920 [Gammaproteobacteria bacterium]|nr:hypothetical protein [Gammaproteobacteria bacterium]